jgi:hypothetical protein
LFVHPDDKEATLAEVKKLSTGADTIAFDNRYRCKDGSYRWLSWRATPFLDQQLIYAVARDVTDRKQAAETLAEQALAERARLAALTAEVGVALLRNVELPEMLHDCVAAVVRHLGAAFARVWTLNPEQNVLELRASAGMYTHLDGPHSRVPVGQLKIGLIAQERKPHLTNQVIGDPRVGDQDWAGREGMVAFAGYPLLIEDRLVGVLAMFARHTLTEATLTALASVADEVALGLERKRIEEELRQTKDVREVNK